MKDELLSYVFSNNRCCPRESRWHELWEMLPKENGVNPPPPLILNGWLYSSGIEKMMCTRIHIEYADQHGAIDAVDAFLRSLPEEDWLHFGDSDFPYMDQE